MKEITVNIKVSEDFNRRRKNLNLSWVEVIEEGLGSKEATDYPNLRPHLKVAIKALGDAWKLYKKE